MTHKPRWLISIAASVCLSVAALVARPHAGNAIAPWSDHRAVEQGPALSGAGGERTGPRADSMRRHVSAAYGKLPLYFIENTGQADSTVKFYERALGHTTFFTADGVYMDLYQPTSRTAHSESRTHRHVVKRGADPSAARFAYSGVAGIAIGEGGELRITLPGGEVLEQRKPVIYQEADGTRVEVEGGYRLYGQYAYGFAVGPYDRGKALIIDPVLMFSYSTYLGGTGQDTGVSIAVDAVGQAYVTGSTFSFDFPTTPGAFDTTYNGEGDAFITKLDAAGSALVYSTYLGPSTTRGYGIALDAVRNVYVTGHTFDAHTLPTTPGALDQTYNGGDGDAFISKISEMAQ